MRVVRFIPIAVVALLLLLPAAAHAQETQADSVSPLDSLRTLEMSQVEALPELKDRRQASRSIVRHYPRALREAGMGGTVVVRARIDAQGMPGQATVATSSGLVELDEAALRAVAEMRFTPARVGGRAVRAWVFFPVSFSAPPPRVVPLDSIGIIP